MSSVFKSRFAELHALGLRVTLFCLAFLLFLFAGPIAACAATLEDSARELAQHIAARWPQPLDVSIEVRNTSELDPPSFAQVEQELRTGLQSAGIPNSLGASAIARLTVTLSQNLQGFVWTAEITQGDKSDVLIMALPGSFDHRTAPDSISMVLRAEKFTARSEPIVDALPFSDGTRNWIALLLSDSFLIQENGAESSSSRMEFPGARSTRDPRGLLTHTGNQLDVQLEMQVCAFELDTHKIANCHPRSLFRTRTGADRAQDSIEEIPPSMLPIWSGDQQLAAIRANCNGSDELLKSGAGDYSVPDSVQAFQPSANGPVAVSNAINFPGPVMAFHFSSGTPRAVVRNLKTGDYEGYLLSITCGQ